MKQLTTKTDDEIIIEHLISDNPKPLSKALQTKLERLDECRDLIRQYGSRVRVAKILMSNYKISRAQAYRIFESTQEVFGTTQKTSREFWLDIIMGFMIDDRQKALIKQDYRSVSSIHKNMIAAVEKLAGDKDTIPFEKVQPPQILIGFFPETTKVELPDDWEAQVKQIIKPKRKIDQVMHDAQIIEEDGE
ncbi:hypothetical protein PBT90_16715 [Algoriphagus halophytocola]|uniref:hypothetical protein n=1 Tax=Algoriphagus halophytocola TaxID=2991499 RepID=UPI0022DE29AF|nr:hypothetical protein [Algoriphagus sp. TR-M9]WBL42380.1 hypothetical protein PBT90_16715 [Algoriphagus sp. TR-M9]